MTKFLKNQDFKKNFTYKIFFDLKGQGKYLQLEKPSGIEIEMPIQKRLAIDLLEGMAKRNLPRS